MSCWTEGFTSITKSHHLDFRANEITWAERSLFKPHYMEITCHQQAHKKMLSKCFHKIRVYSTSPQGPLTVKAQEYIPEGKYSTSRATEMCTLAEIPSCLLRLCCMRYSLWGKLFIFTLSARVLSYPLIKCWNQPAVAPVPKISRLLSKYGHV